MRQRVRIRASVAALGLAMLAACARQDNGATTAMGGLATAADTGVFTLFNAGSLAGPLKAAFDTFALGSPLRLAQESAGSLETARKLTDLGKIPDVIALADYDVFPQLLMPTHVTWYLNFARNRMVLAYTDKSAGAAEADSASWWRIMQRSGVETGHSNPDLDPAGYRTLLVFQLAEAHYKVPGLAADLRRAVPARNIRAKSADLVALLQAGELDYAWEYESVAQAAGLKYVRLPAAIDLGDPGQAEFYGQASVRVAGQTPRDTLVMRGQPIIFALSIPVAAPRPAIAARFVAFLESERGRAVLRASQIDALDQPTLTGDGAPAWVRPAP